MVQLRERDSSPCKQVLKFKSNYGLGHTHGHTAILTLSFLELLIATNKNPVVSSEFDLAVNLGVVNSEIILFIHEKNKRHFTENNSEHQLQISI